MPNKLSIEHIRTEAIRREFKLISQKYKGIYEHHTWECPDKHQWKASVKNVIRNGSGCPYCRVSLSEEKCRFIFEQLTGFPFKRTRKALSKCLELDGYSQSLNLAFEYNGEQHYQKMWYMSQEKFDSLILRDKDKANFQCNKYGHIRGCQYKHLTRSHNVYYAKALAKLNLDETGTRRPEPNARLLIFGPIHN